jgi:GTPase-associated protein 1, N-terminal domain type 2/GTPase-associated protein 1, middle domain
LTAYQLHYTSSARGLSGYPGFQFVALSPGIPAAAEHAVSRYLTYQPPPSAPAQPGPAEMTRLPLAFGYAQERGHSVLTLCRYSGRDYSGRFGNFFGHAIFAEPGDLKGLRPIEFWAAPWWADTAAEPDLARDLPPLSRLRPGDATGPTEVQVMLAKGRDHAYLLLELLIDAVLQVMDKGAGRIVLVADDVDDIAMWMAAVSYSLPYSMTRDLSFVTYSASPEQAPYFMVGTTRDVADRGLQCRCFDLDRRRSDADDVPVSVYARSLVDSWRTGNLMRIDAICDLADLGTGKAGASQVGALSTAAAFRDSASLLALCRDGQPVSERDEPAVVQFIRQHASRFPAWLWTAFRDGTVRNFRLRLAAWRAASELLRTDIADPVGVSCVTAALQQPAYRARLRDGGSLSPSAREQVRPRLEERLTSSTDLRDIAEVAEVATLARVTVDRETLRHATSACAKTRVSNIGAAVLALPDAYAATFRLGVLDGLEAAPKVIREAALDRAACDWIGRQDWRAYPQVGRRVLMQWALAHPRDRVLVAGQLVALCEHVRTGAGEIREMLEELWAGQSPSPGDSQQLLSSAGQIPGLSRDVRCHVASFAWPPSDRLPTEDESRFRLIREVWFLLELDESIRLSADAGLLVALYELKVPGLAGVSAQSLERLAGKASSELAADVIDRAVQTTMYMPPKLQAEILSYLPAGTGGGLGALIRDRLVTSPCDEVADLARLAQVAVSLHDRGTSFTALNERLARIVTDHDSARYKELYRYDAPTATALDRLLWPTDEPSQEAGAAFFRRLLRLRNKEGHATDGNDRP